jgi:tetratricopeptide (TPR) repeat protein
LADIAHKKHNDPDAEKKYVAAIGMAKDIKNSFAEAVERRGIGTLYSDEKKYLPAIGEFNRAVAVDRSLALTNYLAWDLQSLGWVYAAQGQSAEACSSYVEAEALFQKIGYDDYAKQTHEAAAKIPCAK